MLARTYISRHSYKGDLYDNLQENLLLTFDLRTTRDLVHTTICAMHGGTMKAMGVVAVLNKEAFISNIALKQINAAIRIFWSTGMTVITPKTNRRETPRLEDGNIPFDDIAEVAH